MVWLLLKCEETLPAGTASLYHLHRDSDEIAWVLAGEFTFKIGDEVAAGGPGTCAFMPRDVPHAWKNTGRETGRVLFLYTPAAAGGLIEALAERRPADPDEHKQLFERHRWEVVGPNRFERRHFGRGLSSGAVGFRRGGYQLPNAFDKPFCAVDSFAGHLG